MKIKTLSKSRYNRTNASSSIVVVPSVTQKAIFGYGYASGYASMTNLVSNIGIVTNDATGVGTARWGLAAAGYSTS